MSVKEMAKGITYDDPIKTRYVFSVWKVSHSYFRQYVVETGGNTPKPAVPRGSLDSCHPPTVGHHPVTS